MNNAIPTLAIRFLILFGVQIFIFNNVSILGYINPFVYILFILLFPLRTNQEQFLIISFLIGLVLDLFMDTGGIHATACVTVAFLRPTFLKIIFGVAYDYMSIKFDFTDFLRKMTYVFTLILIHNFVVIALERFSFSHFLLSLWFALLTSAVTFFISIILLILFKYKT